MEVNPGYKVTEAGVVPEDWDVSDLSSLSATSSGTTPKRAMHERYYKNGSVAWVKTMDLTNSGISATSERVTERALKETCLRVYPIGTVLIAMYGGFQQIGRTGLLRIPSAVNQAITAIQPNTDALVPEFLLATLNHRVGYWKNIASSSRKDPNITGQDVRDFPIAYPRPAEQRAIATALDDLGALLSALEGLIAKKRDLKQAAMQQLLSCQTRLPNFDGEWETKRLGEEIILLSGHHVLAQHCNTEGHGVPYLTGPADFPHGRIASTKFTEHPSTICAPNDILVTVKGSGSGTIVLADGAYCISRQLMAIRLRKSDCRFIYYSLLQNAAKVKAASTGLIPGLSRSDILDQPLPLPPTLDEQSAIAAVLTDMDAELAALEQRREKTRALKQGMMQELLTGRTRLV